MRLLTSLLILMMSFAVLAEDKRHETKLSEFIAKFPPVSERVKNANFGMLFLEVTDQNEAYRFFHEGPKDNERMDNPALREWRKEKAKMNQPALDLVRFVLDNYNSEDVNLFQLEMMKRYLDEPESRMAIIAVLEAFAAEKFDWAHYEAIENQKDTLPHVGTGALGGFGIAMLACVVRPSRCRDLVKQGNLAKEALEQAEKVTRVSRAQRIKNAVRGVIPKRRSKTERIWGDLLDELPQAPKLINTVKKVDTAGGKATRMSYYFKYMRLSGKEKRMRLRYLAYGMGGGAAGWTALQKLKNAYQEGKWDYQVLDPNELERRYFGALSIVEMTCEAKQIDLEAEMTYQQIRDYVLSMQEQLIIMGRMSGGLEFYDKVPLEFVTPLPDTDEILVRLPLAKDLPLDEDGNRIGEFKRKCPGISRQGLNIESSFTELQDIYNALVQKGAMLLMEEAEKEAEAELLEAAEQIQDVIQEAAEVSNE